MTEPSPVNPLQLMVLIKDVRSRSGWTETQQGPESRRRWQAWLTPAMSEG
jgi:hypothetical protein